MEVRAIAQATATAMDCALVVLVFARYKTFSLVFCLLVYDNDIFKNADWVVLLKRYCLWGLTWEMSFILSWKLLSSLMAVQSNGNQYNV